MKNNFEIVFNFPERDAKDIDRVNEILSYIPLSYLEIKENNGGYDSYVGVSKQYDKNRVLTNITYRLGFDSLTLLCTAGTQEDMYYYQIDTRAFPKEILKNSEDFEKIWRQDHPDRVARVFTTLSFDQSNAWGFVILHHKKVEKGK
ncbi:MAG: hypothetical protein IJP48_12060 [Synergistaceae bacterium]|nr:hypothetical protein [Synergistaceae bacterium]